MVFPPAAPATLWQRLKTARPMLSPLTYAALTGAWILLVDNRTFWGRAIGIFGDKPLQLATFGAAVAMLTLFTIFLFGPGRALKPVAIFLVILSAVTGYYQDSLGITLDREMVQNVMKTTFKESKHLITPAYLLHLALFGILPALVLGWLGVKPRGWIGAAWRWVLALAVTLGLMVALLLSDFKAFSAVIREHRELMGSYQPGAPIAGTYEYAKLVLKTTNVVVAPLGRDAQKGPLLTGANKPVLTILWAGETVRAQNFGLNGYARDTTPELAKRDVVYFPDVVSCGTSTAVSLPCMFSPLPRDDYSQEAAAASENVLDVLTHAGVKVEWWDNNTGHQGNAQRVPNRMMEEADDPAACAGGECTDAIFLNRLQRTIDTMTEDTVLVLHQIGSHGPAYYLRYPPEFRRFTPTCDTSSFDACSVDQIVNTYDNTVLFTDHILAQSIDMLAGQDRVIGAMIYVSDHGESLGEDGLYLHGAPYFMAPETQTRVPMVMWFSDAYKAAFGLDQGCMTARAGQVQASHDNLFHTLLGMMNIQTAVRDAALDLTAGCTR